MCVFVCVCVRAYSAFVYLKAIFVYGSPDACKLVNGFTLELDERIYHGRRNEVRREMEVANLAGSSEKEEALDLILGMALCQKARVSDRKLDRGGGFDSSTRSHEELIEWRSSSGPHMCSIMHTFHLLHSQRHVTLYFIDTEQKESEGNIYFQTANVCAILNHYVCVCVCVNVIYGFPIEMAPLPFKLPSQSHYIDYISA